MKYPAMITIEKYGRFCFNDMLYGIKWVSIEKKAEIITPFNPLLFDSVPILFTITLEINKIIELSINQTSFFLLNDKGTPILYYLPKFNPESNPLINTTPIPIQYPPAFRNKNHIYDFEASISQYFTLENAFVRNPKPDYPEIKHELHQLKQIDFHKLHAYPTF